MKKSILFCSLLLLLCFFDLSAIKIKRPFVTCHLNGQLGNQLFEISTALAYAWDHSFNPIFPELSRSDLNIPLNYEKIFFRLNASLLPRPISTTFEQFSAFTLVDLPWKRDIDLRGLFQSWQYFNRHREKLLKTYAPKPKELECLKKKHADILNHPLTVGMHVRTFNRAWSNVIPFVGMDYYQKAMDLFPPETLFVVFSDRINWCKHHFKSSNRNLTFIENQDHVDDLFLMSMLTHNIIGNSTFSWWAAYLNKNPNKIVVTPSHYVHPDAAIHHGTGINTNMPDWIVIDINCYAPYPEDMNNYDNYSQSLDTQ